VKTISLKLADGLDQRLTATARRQRTTKSDLLRTALQAFLNEEIGNRSGSCLDLAGDLVGSVEGPSDLSANRQHMKGFGK
jgi:hypothetical protein